MADETIFTKIWKDMFLKKKSIHKTLISKVFLFF